LLTKQQLSELKQSLVEMKHEIEGHDQQEKQFGLLRSDAHDSTGELSSYDNHPADTGTETFERGKDLALNELIHEQLEEINEALKAMDDHTYGKCRTCGKEIGVERLEALPTALYCKQHSPEQSVSKDRPIEEASLRHPFGQYEFDEKFYEPYDSEDSWQDVARYGTSESPSDFVEDTENYSETYIEADEALNYVEDYESFAATDMYGNPLPLYPNKKHEMYEDMLDEEGTMTIFGDLPRDEKEPYIED